MTRLNLLLLLTVLGSALYLVNVQYESRRLFTEIDRASAEARRLELESERLQVEKRAQATPSRVQKLAREQLQMHSATPAITQYVKQESQQSRSTEAAAVAGQPATPASAGRIQ